MSDSRAESSRSPERDGRDHRRGDGSHRTHHRHDRAERSGSRRDRDSHGHREGKDTDSRPLREQRRDDSEAAQPTHSARERRRDSHHQRKRQRSPSASPSSSGSSSSSEESSERVSNEVVAHPKLAEYGAKPIGPEDYFLRSTEFRHWLLLDSERRARHRDGSRRKKSRSGHLEDLSSRQAHRLFDSSFVPRWNEARLSSDFYLGKLTPNSLPSTSHKWSFVGQRTAKEQEQIAAMRDTVESLTHGTSRGAQEARRADSRRSRARLGDDDAPTNADEQRGTVQAPGSGANVGAADAGWQRKGNGSGEGPRAAGPVAGPSLPRPSHPSDSRFAMEEAREADRRYEQASRRAARRDMQERDAEQQELLLGRSAASSGGGREAQMERRREQNRANREFEAARRGGADDSLVSEDLLMGGGDSFQETVAAQQRRPPGGSSKREEAREARRMEKEHEVATKRQEYRQKEDKTMQMLRDLAKSRFG
ncbi:unnamed protein product [Parajaminaea phylloscopi]